MRRIAFHLNEFQWKNMKIYHGNWGVNINFPYLQFQTSNQTQKLTKNKIKIDFFHIPERFYSLIPVIIKVTDRNQWKFYLKKIITGTLNIKLYKTKSHPS